MELAGSKGEKYKREIGREERSGKGRKGMKERKWRQKRGRGKSGGRVKRGWEGKSETKREQRD